MLESEANPDPTLLHCPGCLNGGITGTAVVGEIKKGKYIYYHCSHSRGKCNEPYIREEQFSQMLGEPLRDLKINNDVLAWMTAALKASSSDERRQHEETCARINQQIERVTRRMHQMYDDKLDGIISESMYLQKRKEYEAELDRLQASLERHSRANIAYLDNGVRLLELAQRAYSLYLAQPPAEQWKLLDLLYSNSYLRNGRIEVVFRKPFNLLAYTVIGKGKKKPNPRRNRLKLNYCWEAGIRTPILWSRAICPAVGRPPRGSV